MTVRRAIFGLVLLAGGPPAFAHQVDEYLQTAFISLSKDSVRVEMFLTPGVAVLPTVLAALDPKGEGVISDAEQRTYAGQVVRDLSASVNGEELRPRLISANFPSFDDMKAGLGTIHLELKIDLPPSRSRRHLTWENHHQSPISAYQVNCLMPADPAIAVVSDHRNYSQSRYEVEYSDGGTMGARARFGGAMGPPPRPGCAFGPFASLVVAPVAAPPRVEGGSTRSQDTLDVPPFTVVANESLPPLGTGRQIAAFDLDRAGMAAPAGRTCPAVGFEGQCRPSVLCWSNHRLK